ncbi:MAG: peptide chain release factor 2 [Omnitrophica bacterium RIFCSPLOWO2_12_FULL_44_17]|uniref:Peptide chain release factor 2 n=1 Tax=Candidatus Danuiimicrobium aquiferis TaxID=1801832 RepID=A0A1G1L054_9BACT|nr:MAG: peptide chain release factor 2 [Omnitrophica bacterium RIFCSPHIGHO2_02_FULL_45_28]OGW98530.1 MAG: peptide chain release factor 2 [Omnitrophica bacterium RIFCSPLOWO2_12_FULL_44_17]OGX05083.1 MAG: peptide chain release factor 2 [Omnitrophica bacterium RIFCSPLOWO2_02_FULL_44_11]
MGEAGFWDKPTEAKEIISKLKILKRLVDPWKKVDQETRDLEELLTMIGEDESSLVELETNLSKIKHEVDNLELQRLLSGPLDGSNAIISINAGAGGTESCDWAQMLLRMYMRWIEKTGFKFQMIDLQAGEEAGTKSATLLVEGPYAYGYLKCERGVHRLVRISPFDANKRRHTSFASLDVIAEIADDVEFEIDENELRIDVYRAGGAGGQHVNKTSSAVRLTHVPTGIVVQCQNERSQHQNKQVAMKVLKARLYERKREEDEAKLKEHYGEKKEIAWGSQIRSYVFHPYTMVKDHRTDCETSNGQAVMDGELGEFIEAYLKFQAKEQSKS